MANDNILHGTIGGTLISVIYNLPSDILHTVVVAFVGAIISFATSTLSKHLVQKYGRKKKK